MIIYLLSRHAQSSRRTLNRVNRITGIDFNAEMDTSRELETPQNLWWRLRETEKRNFNLLYGDCLKAAAFHIVELHWLPYERAARCECQSSKLSSVFWKRGKQSWNQKQANSKNYTPHEEKILFFSSAWRFSKFKNLIFFSNLLNSDDDDVLSCVVCGSWVWSIEHEPTIQSRNDFRFHILSKLKVFFYMK